MGVGWTVQQLSIKCLLHRADNHGHYDGAAQEAIEKWRRQLHNLDMKRMCLHRLYVTNCAAIGRLIQLMIVVKKR